MLEPLPGASREEDAAATLAAAAKTLREAEASWLQIIFSSVTFAPRGLYGGKLVLGKGLGFTLTRYSAAPGVLVTGKIAFVDRGPPITVQGNGQGLGLRGRGRDARRSRRTRSPASSAAAP